jgi:hypothetical protein
MRKQSPVTDDSKPVGANQRRARLFVRCLQLVFCLIAAVQFDSPFLSVHNERQNQTYDIARHIFHDGWSAVLAPKASFSYPGYEERAFTIIRQEFPFHGLFGWPLVKLFGHERAVVRLVSIAFALLSIEFLFLILKTWLAPASAAAGAALWALSPLVLQFGQVPMPDILATTGMLGAFWFALKPNLPASSGWFLFAVLAKINVIFFGLPILTALLLARNCRSAGELTKIVLLWGAAPLIGLLAWTSLEVFGSETPWTVLKMINSQRGGMSVLLALHFYVFLAGCLLPYGIGLAGIGGLVITVFKRPYRKIRMGIALPLLVAGVLYVLAVLAKIQEPQYILPLLAWLAAAAAFGLDCIIGKPLQLVARIALAGAAGLHLLMVLVFSCNLKSSRVPDFPSIEMAARLIPPNSRVIVAYHHYGASPAIWLNQNVFAVPFATNNLEAHLPVLRQTGFAYILIMDLKAFQFSNAGRSGLRQDSFHANAEKPPGRDEGITDFANPESPFRRLCDGRFDRIFSSKYAVLYSLNSPKSGQP